MLDSHSMGERTVVLKNGMIPGDLRSELFPFAFGRERHLPDRRLV